MNALLAPYGRTINEATLQAYRDKLTACTEADLREIAAMALYHLQCVSGSRNSFDFSAMAEESGIAELYVTAPRRHPAVEAMQHEAAQFIAHFRE